VLSIACAKLGANRVLAVDLDEVAVKVAKLNVKVNKVQEVVEVKHGNLADHVDGTYQLVVANILAEVILRLVDDAYRLLSPGGVFIASGIIENKRKDVEEALRNAGFTIIDIESEEDWVSIVSRK